MRSIDTTNLIRYSEGKYKGKIDWSNNIGVKLKFIYHEISGEIEIINYIKAIPQGTVTVKYNDNIKQMKTNMLTKCSIGELIKYNNYDYIYNVGDILTTNYNSTIQIIKQIKLFHTKYNERGYEVKCLDCNHTYNIREVHVSSCPLCSDRVSYGEKFTINLLQQLNVEFEVQKTFDWSGWKRYDIYLPKYNLIIEVNGLEHYEPSSFNPNMTKEEYLIYVQKNDKEKYELAISNNIQINNYIIIDARKSKREYIKQSIKQTILNNLFILNNIDWIKCDEFATSFLIKKACELWKNKIPIIKIAKKIGRCESTITQYLLKGNELGYCIYDKHINHSKATNKFIHKLYKPVICITTGEVFESQLAATNAYKIYRSGVSDCCAGRISSAGKHPETGERLIWKYYNGVDQ